VTDVDRSPTRRAAIRHGRTARTFDSWTPATTSITKNPDYWNADEVGHADDRFADRRDLRLNGLAAGVR
jgi:hypothetical protein